MLLFFTGFYRDLLDFTGFYWVLLGFTGFYWVLLGFHWFSLGLNRFLPGFCGFSGQSLWLWEVEVMVDGSEAGAGRSVDE